MKKILVVAVLILLLTGCGGTMNTEIPKGYISKTEYYDKDGIQDHTDYAKYVYDKVISPVNDILSLIITPFICESIAVTIDIPADGPSLLIAPSVKLI